MRTRPRGNALLIFLMLALALILGCAGLGYLIYTREQSAAPAPASMQATPAAVTAAAAPASTPAADAGGAVARVKQRTLAGISNGAKVELLQAWGKSGLDPTWEVKALDQPGHERVQVGIRTRTGQTVSLVWQCAQDRVEPENEAATQLEAWSKLEPDSPPQFFLATAEAGSAGGLAEAGSAGGQPRAAGTPLEPSGSEDSAGDGSAPAVGSSSGSASDGSTSPGSATAENVTAENVTAGNPTAGNVTAGNPTAGSTTAGSTTAGNATAGNPTTRPAPRPRPGQPPPPVQWPSDGNPNVLSNADLPAVAIKPPPTPGKKPAATSKPGSKPGSKASAPAGGRRTDPNLGSAGNIQLIGVMEADGHKRAHLSQAGQFFQVGVGENVGSYTVVSIEPGAVVLDKNGSRVRITTPRPGTPPAQPPPTRLDIDPDMQVPGPEPIPEPTFDPGPFDGDGK